jgi:hypothetical protein
LNRNQILKSLLNYSKISYTQATTDGNAREVLRLDTSNKQMGRGRISVWYFLNAVLEHCHNYHMLIPGHNVILEFECSH